MNEPIQKEGEGLRRRFTPAEDLLWKSLKSKRVEEKRLGFKVIGFGNQEVFEDLDQVIFENLLNFTQEVSQSDPLN